MIILLFQGNRYLTNVCMQIFIPMREPSEVGHWYLLEVQVAKILDSAPNKLRYLERHDVARMAISII